MKRKVIFLVCMIISIIASGQIQEQKLLGEIEVTPPKFTGIKGVVTILQEEKFESIADYLGKNVQYPEEALERWLEGTEVVQFIVTPTGEVTGFNVINSVSSEIDEELIRVLKTTSGMWLPGSNNGEPVAMEKEVSIVFKMGETKYQAKTNDFATKAKVFLKNGNNKFLVKRKPHRALKFYDNGIKLLPHEESLLLMRGLCRYELGDKEGARLDWDRMKTLSGNDFGTMHLTYNLYDLKGYAELICFLDEEE